MVRLDLHYARTRSFWTDIKILLATPRAVVSGRAPVEAGGLVIGSELLALARRVPGCPLGLTTLEGRYALGRERGPRRSTSGYDA